MAVIGDRPRLAEGAEQSLGISQLQRTPLSDVIHVKAEALKKKTKALLNWLNDLHRQWSLSLCLPPRL